MHMRTVLAILAVAAIPGAVGAAPSLPPLQFVVFCQHYPSECKATAPAKGTFAFDRLETINTSVNRSIKPLNESNLDWQLFPASGNCNDYVVSKRHLLLSEGWGSSQLLIAEVVLRGSGEHHLVLIVKGTETWVLDNLSDEPLSLEQVDVRYELVRAQTSSNPQFWQTSLEVSRP